MSPYLRRTSSTTFELTDYQALAIRSRGLLQNMIARRECESPSIDLTSSLFTFSHYAVLALNASFGAHFTDEGNVTIECRACRGTLTSNVTWITLNPFNIPTSNIITSGMFGEIATYLNLQAPLTLVYQCSMDNVTSPLAGVSIGKQMRSHILYLATSKGILKRALLWPQCSRF